MNWHVCFFPLNKHYKQSNRSSTFWDFELHEALNICQAVGVTVESMKQNHFVLMTEKALAAACCNLTKVLCMHSMACIYVCHVWCPHVLVTRQNVMLIMPPFQSAWTTLRSSWGTPQISMVLALKILKRMRLHTIAISLSPWNDAWETHISSPLPQELKIVFFSNVGCSKLLPTNSQEGIVTS